MHIVIAYFIIINLVLFITMGIDKRRAKKGDWRVPEKNLFLLAAIGGSVGGILGMQLFRHKTKHKSFLIGFPCILILQCAVLIWFCIFS